METLPQKVQDWLGRSVVLVQDVMIVQSGLWENFCSAVQDGNPLYWEESVAREIIGERIAPPAMTPSWAIDHRWRPNDRAPPLRTLELHFMMRDALNLPFGIVKSVEYIFHEPVRDGARVSARQILESVGELRANKLGRGRDWTIRVEYLSGEADMLCVQKLNCFGYEPHGD